MQTFSGCCATVCIKVMHPESKFRSVWNVALAFFILYCGFAVPFEIAFETDMVKSMCTGYMGMASEKQPLLAPKPLRPYRRFPRCRVEVTVAAAAAAAKAAIV